MRWRPPGPSGLDPAFHYVRYGAAEGRRPCPGFDTRWYLWSYPDVAASGLNPLLHFHRYGRGEGRQPLPVSSPGDDVPVLRVPFGFRSGRAPRLRYAALLHLYYPELVHEFRAALSYVGVPLDVYVTTCGDAARAAIEAAFAGWTQGKVEVRVVPNRGRDIAPRLVGLADVYARYDVVLMLHSKRSRHDEELDAWRGFLLRHLVGSAPVVQSIVMLFEEHPQVGLVAAPHFGPIRRNVGWGRNLVQAERLAGRLGLPLDRQRPVDFPSGSMFWARTAALSPLVRGGLRLDDFEAESGDTDGTLAHAVERLFFYSAEASGRCVVRVSPDESSRAMPVPDAAALRRGLARAQFVTRAARGLP